MGKLAEYVRSEADSLKREAEQSERELNVWLSAVTSLTDRLRRWVADADAGHGLLATSDDVHVTALEPGLGEYRVPGLRITLGGRPGRRTADIVPRARYVAGRIAPPGEPGRRADGMVEIRSGSSPEYYLFRVAGGRPEDDRWFIRDAHAWDSRPGDDTVEPLDRDRFEAAILRVLR